MHMHLLMHMHMHMHMHTHTHLLIEMNGDESLSALPHCTVCNLASLCWRETDHLIDCLEGKEGFICKQVHVKLQRSPTSPRAPDAALKCITAGEDDRFASGQAKIPSPCYRHRQSIFWCTLCS